jgi:hypothetical protein
MIAGLLLVAAFVFGAQMFSPRWTTTIEMDRYVRAGPRLGTGELERDLLAAHPPGSDVGPLFARLSRLGFSCGGTVDPARGAECRFRARRDDNRVVDAAVEVRHDGLRVQAITVRMGFMQL